MLEKMAALPRPQPRPSSMDGRRGNLGKTVGFLGANDSSRTIGF